MSGAVQQTNPRTNARAIAALLLGLTLPPLAIPLGHSARAQIIRTDERGDGLAVAGLVLGYLGLIAVVIAIIAVVVYAR